MAKYMKLTQELNKSEQHVMLTLELKVTKEINKSADFSYLHDANQLPAQFALVTMRLVWVRVKNVWIGLVSQS